MSGGVTSGWVESLVILGWSWTAGHFTWVVGFIGMGCPADELLTLSSTPLPSLSGDSVKVSCRLLLHCLSLVECAHELSERVSSKPSPLSQVSMASFGSWLPRGGVCLLSALPQVDQETVFVCASLAGVKEAIALIVDGNGRLLTPSNASRSKLSDSLLQVNGASKLQQTHIQTQRRGMDKCPLFEQSHS